ncbi:condensation domain-containing protein, partial [Streptomyces sp. W16]|uniref:condensation domain-containing protein n=1 Tax=Streptomyces sp. W16 TaxID=3076631 RepID=UPI00295BD4CF
MSGPTITEPEQGPTAGPPDEVFALPTSCVQRGVWAMHQASPGHAVLAVPEAIAISGRLDLTALRAAFAELIRRHEALRTAFREADGDLVAEVHAEVPFELPLTDLSGLAPEEREAETGRLIADQVASAPDPACVPLLGGLLIRNAPDDHVLVCVGHLLVYDAASRDIFAGELGALYSAYVQGREPALPAPTLQYPDVAHWQNESLRTGSWNAQIDHWRTTLADAPAQDPGNPRAARGFDAD